MGCDDPREKLENKIMEMNIDKIEIQMEKYNQLKLLGQEPNICQIKFLDNNTNNIDIINPKIKRKSMGLKTTKSTKIGKEKRRKSMKTARVKEIKL